MSYNEQVIFTTADKPIEGKVLYTYGLQEVEGEMFGPVLFGVRSGDALVTYIDLNVPGENQGDIELNVLRDVLDKLRFRKGALRRLIPEGEPILLVVRNLTVLEGEETSQYLTLEELARWTYGSVDISMSVGSNGSKWYIPGDAEMLDHRAFNEAAMDDYYSDIKTETYYETNNLDTETLWDMWVKVTTILGFAQYDGKGNLKYPTQIFDYDGIAIAFLEIASHDRETVETISSIYHVYGMPELSEIKDNPLTHALYLAAKYILRDLIKQHKEGFPTKLREVTKEVVGVGKLCRALDDHDGLALAVIHYADDNDIDVESVFKSCGLTTENPRYVYNMLSIHQKGIYKKTMELLEKLK